MTWCPLNRRQMCVRAANNVAFSLKVASVPILTSTSYVATPLKFYVAALFQWQRRGEEASLGMLEHHKSHQFDPIEGTDTETVFFTTLLTSKTSRYRGTNALQRRILSVTIAPFFDPLLLLLFPKPQLRLSLLQRLSVLLHLPLKLLLILCSLLRPLIR